MNAKKLLIVDGSNLLFQMFFGMPARITNRKGNAVHGTLGFVGALFKIVRAVRPTHVAVLFDGEHENARTALNAEYKANRPNYGDVPDAQLPFSQLPDIVCALDRSGIKHAETTVCETDDWIAGYVKTYAADASIVISSFDSDFFQLITDGVYVLRYRGVKTTICTPSFVKERLGVTPDKYADFKALVGDPSDNIKGADKVGPKTAALLLNKFGTLENVIRNADEIARPSIRRSITDGAERLRTNYKLIKLDGDAPLPFALDELAVGDIDISSTELLKQIGVLP